MKERIFSQFRRPHGLLGHVVGRLMATRGSNLERTRRTVELVKPEPGGRVLELGFGPGLGVEAVMATAGPDTRVMGVDHSEVMAGQAARRNRVALDDGTVHLVVGDAQALPELGRFDRIFSVNVWQFWDDQIATLRDLGERLVPEGRLAVSYQPRSGEISAAAAEAAGDRLEEQFAAAGLSVTERHLIELEPAPAVCVIGSGPSA